MKALPTDIVQHITNAQCTMYERLNRSGPLVGYLGAIPVAFLDVGLQTSKRPIWIAQKVALAAINILGMSFNLTWAFGNDKEYSLKDALSSMRWAFCWILQVPVIGLIAPFKFVYQLLATLSDPKKATSISCYQGMHMLPDCFNIVNTYASKQDDLYKQKKCLPLKIPSITAPLVAVLVTLSDVVLEVSKTPIDVLQYVALAAINAVGVCVNLEAVIGNKYSFKAALLHVEDALCTASSIPVVGLMAPFAFVYQLLATLSDPENATSIRR